MTGTTAPHKTTLNGSIPLYAALRDALRAAILSGRYEEDSPMPSESALGHRYKVSRITVRQALSELQREGLIYKVNGKGSYVNLPRVYQSLQRLEGFGEAMSRLGFASTNRILRKQVVAVPAAVAPRLALAPGTPVSKIVWVRILDGMPFCYEISYLPLDFGVLLAPEKLAGRDMFAVLEQDHGHRLGKAELSIEAVLANRTYARYLQTAVGRPCLRIERLTYLESGQPFDFDYLVFRGDAFQYRVSISREYPKPCGPPHFVEK
jgi:GntR family transcriptional regulator